MRHIRVGLFAWLLTAAGATIGAVAGNLVGQQGLFLGASVLATLAVLLAIELLVERGWLDGERRRGGSIGGLSGLAIGGPVALMNLHSPLLAIAALAMVGVGVLFGAGRNAVR